MSQLPNVPMSQRLRPMSQLPNVPMSQRLRPMSQLPNVPMSQTICSFGIHLAHWFIGSLVH